MFEFVPLWNITVFFAYALRRVNCETCGVKVERVPWADGKSTLTKTYMQFLATWAKRLSLRFSRTFGKERSAQLLFICSDMWKPYLTVIAKKAGQAIHVLDRFHIAMHMNKAIDEVRAKETRELKAKGLAPILTHSRWCLLKRPENLTSKQEVKLIDLLRRPSLS
jgi:transposase